LNSSHNLSRLNLLVAKKREAMGSVGIEHRSLGDQRIDHSLGWWGR